LQSRYTKEFQEKRKVCVVIKTRVTRSISPMRWDEIVGTVATKDYKEDELI
jgi:sialic acid synthase SpsE